ncbi:hypothetical protein TKK_0012367 [Trichogramma kaykai]|uniref:GYF domain-containing protein n=1 Tax=Trichogramma kaykai TaxID=54128 RepID=A0ABD2WMV2_9HYME
MSKRKLDEYLETKEKPSFKHSLDSDEEDEEEKEEYHNVMSEKDIEGEEDGPSTLDTNHGFTAFNMKEELEEGHFDKEGHYHWKKDKEVRDNWLDNIDWVKVKDKVKEDENNEKNDADNDSDNDPDFMFDPTSLYKQILDYLKPGETVSKALCRLGKGKQKLTTAQRWKLKKDRNAVKNEDENSVAITKLTELANELLTRTGNMDIYQETHEKIQKKITEANKASTKIEAECDMFSDEFESKEKLKLKDSNDAEGSAPKDLNQKEDPLVTEVSWELKWSQEKEAEVHGPHTSEQMHTWSKEGYFKNGAWVRKIGQNGDFHSAARIDFELYI